MRGETRAPVLGGVETLQQQRLIALHLREIEPSMGRVERDGVDLSRTVAIPEVARNEIANRHAFGVTNGQRRFLDRAADRPPYVDFDEAMLQQLIRLIW